MDSLTHFALGACLGATTLGRRASLRQVAIAGGILANLPDLDVFWPFDDPVDSFVLHRAATHSLIMQAAAVPMIGEILRRMIPGLKDARWACYAAVWLCLASHSLLDYFTIYGTQLFWPLSREALALGNIFVIDPLYTLPLLAPLIWALWSGKWSRRFAKSLAAGLVLSSAYMGWTAIGQAWAQSRAVKALAASGIAARQILAAPTPLNSLLWRVIALDGPRYYNVYVPVLGGDASITVYAHRREPALGDCLAGSAPLRALQQFSHGFYRLDIENGQLVWSDLRMGLTPLYTFRFALAQRQADGYKPMAPRRVRGPRASEGDIDWLLAGMQGSKAIRPLEANDLLAAARPAILPSAPAAPGC